MNAFIKRSIFSCHGPCVLEPRNLGRTDQKQPDGLTLVPWTVGKQHMWDVTVIVFVAPSRISAGLVCYPGTAEAEER